MSSNWWSDPEESTDDEAVPTTSPADAFKIDEALFGAPDAAPLDEEAAGTYTEPDTIDAFDLDSILADNDPIISTSSTETWNQTEDFDSVLSTASESMPVSHNHEASAVSSAIMSVDSSSAPADTLSSATDGDAYNWQVHVDVDQPVQQADL